ncbi:S-adenosyl-L-methionine-dependent methyltransferase [Bimuria novae-zelandiae CBS 107.79]|uniref:S-adenosyl-L-methionine-dependent methyltransferase n=1 Tax=Bimuria novae-zelandiae CBS 107.79 TaxID=1447943 RepID=A0A6A5VLI1_9PLEO|nr:S-adenosyl-L-methionine-dependent methyltransferase [Bimuria novae-zelandiae CBS 107.79]
MGWFNSGPGLEPTGLTLVETPDSLARQSLAIARRHGSVRFIVQDRPETIADGIKRLRSESKDQITFTEHDFFEAQPIVVDVYLFRWILHDWSDTYAIKILRALIPVLKKNAKVILNEFVLPPPGVASAFTNKILRTMDLSMLELHNGKEREVDDWTKLLEFCDARFQFDGVIRLPESRLGIVHTTWTA